MGFEPTTISLATRSSTTELLPHYGVTSRIRTGGFTDLQSVALDHSAIVTWYQQVVTLHPNQPYESRSNTCSAGMVRMTGIEPVTLPLSGVCSTN